MAVERRFTDQLPIVVTGHQYELVREESSRRKVSIARVIRDLINLRYNLLEDFLSPDDPRLSEIEAAIATRRAVPVDAAIAAAHAPPE